MSIKLAIFVSGRGSNLEAILQSVDEGKLDAIPQVVMSNKKGVGALAIAKRYGVPSHVIEGFRPVGVDDRIALSRKEHEELILAALDRYSIDYVVLAGYMKILSPFFLSHFKTDEGYYRVINIHPSLLPAFPGASAYDMAFQSGVPESGITVHLVDEQVDHGPVLAQRSFPRYDDDTSETFQARGLAIEHELYPAVLQKIAERGLFSLIREPIKS